MKSFSYDITITSYCQAFCIGCARNTIDGNKRKDLVESHISVTDFKNIVKSITASSKYPVKHIQLCGEYGDPMMHPDIEDIIDIALEHTDYIMINTNGGLRNANWYEHMAIKYGPRLYIHWSIDGLDHDTNWLYRKGVVFERAWNNMTKYFTAGGSGCWDFIVFDWNVHQIPDVVDIAKSLQADYDIKITLSDNNRDGIIENSSTHVAALNYLSKLEYDKV